MCKNGSEVDLEKTKPLTLQNKRTRGTAVEGVRPSNQPIFLLIGREQKNYFKKRSKLFTSDNQAGMGETMTQEI